MADSTKFDVYKNLPKLAAPPKESIKVLLPNGAYVYFNKGSANPNIVKYGNGDIISLYDGKVIKVVHYFEACD